MSNLLTLIECDGFHFQRVATTHGGEYSGKCCFCGGRDRFIVWPNYKGGRYWCRRCDQKGDVIQYLRDYRGLSYKSAYQVSNNIRPVAYPPAAARSKENSERVHSVSERWSEQAANFLEVFQEHLWGAQGKDALAFLHGKGLNDDTIKVAGIGYNCIDRYRDRSDFGLPEELNEKGHPKKVWIPAGIVIPYIVNDKIIRLRVRRLEHNANSKYTIVTGSDTAPINFPFDRAHAQAGEVAEGDNCIIITESEIDGWLIWQSAANLISIIALGTAQGKPDTKMDHLLRQSKLILIALDADEAGAKASQYWLRTYSNSIRWPVPAGTDPSSAWQAGLNIRDWIKEALIHADNLKSLPLSLRQDAATLPLSIECQQLTEEQIERLCIMTLDGKLPDPDALAQINRNNETCTTCHFSC